MGRRVRLFLIRHGETVDNVAQVYAGSTDSELTNHGYQQATRLGLHLKAQGVTFSHIFSSHLQRAVKTATQIREAQFPGGADAIDKVAHVVQLPVLMEQDFGFYEGMKFHERAANPTPKVHKDTAGFVDVESKESVAQRADAFLDNHLLPLLASPSECDDHVIAVVSHGITLSVLWKRLLLRLPQKSVAFSPEVLVGTPAHSLERLGGWSNTGYLELHMQKAAAPGSSAALSKIPTPTSELAPSKDVEGPAKADTGIQDALHLPSVNPPVRLHGWLTVIETVNGRDHLIGLKRTGGGVGSSRHDASQKSIESFFKKRRVE